jgi:CheY-like chemotaxis protein
MGTQTLLVIDDDPNIRRLLAELLSSRAELRLLIAGDGKEAVRCFVHEKVDVVLTDIHMPGFTGLELMADMQKVKFKPEILVMTANATPENVETARKIGARSVILKPFDNLDIVETEIDKALRAAAAAGTRKEQGQKAVGTPPIPSVRPGAPARPSGPAPAAPSRTAAPTPGTPPAGAPGRSVTVPDYDAWKLDLIGNETPAVPQAHPAARQTEPAPRRAAATAMPRPVAPAPAAPRAAEAAPPPQAAASRPSSSGQAEAPTPSPPPDLEAIFRMIASLDVGKIGIQVPIVCLQTWEEQVAIQAMKHLAVALQRDFYTWSAARGIQKEGQAMGEVYRDPNRALEFIRRQKEKGVYVLADFRRCLEDSTVVRSLREMVMEMETARSLLVLTGPRLPIPPELQPACASFDWPAGGGSDLEALYEEVVAEISSSSGQPIRLDGAARQALLERARGMPTGRARFEIARALMARKAG